MCQSLCQSASPHSVKAAVSSQIRYFLKGGGMNKKRKMLCYSPLVGGQNGTPVFGSVMKCVMRCIYRYAKVTQGT